MQVRVSKAAGAVRSRAFPRCARRVDAPALLLCVLALLIQSLLVQTHIHLPWLEHAGAPASVEHNGPIAHDHVHHGVPAHGDADHCPLCQALLHDGVFTAPALDLPALVPAVWHVITPPLPVAVTITAVSHSWQGRAPPRR